MIEIKSICKKYGDKEVLKDLSLNIEDGSIFGLIGLNGSGKSTLLRIISGIYNYDSGSVTIDGESIYDNPKVKSNIFFLPDEPFYDHKSTPLSLIKLYKVFYKFDENQYIDLLNKFKLPLKKPIHNFSKGMQRQLFISLALAIKPKYLLLDEAFDGLDPIARLEFKRLLIQAAEEKDITVIISSHSLRELEDICDSYGLIDNMKITSSGDIVDEINKVHKYQVAFKKNVTRDCFNNINIIKKEEK